MVCKIDSRPFDEWTKEELKAIARAHNVKMSTALGKARTKRGLWQAIKAVKAGKGAVRHQCSKSPRSLTSGYCARPGSLKKGAKCPREKVKKAEEPEMPEAEAEATQSSASATPSPAPLVLSRPPVSLSSAPMPSALMPAPLAVLPSLSEYRKAPSHL